MKRIKISDVLDPSIAQPFTSESLSFLQDNTKEMLYQIMGALNNGTAGTYQILWGCVETDDGAGTHFSCTAGAIMDDEGEIYAVPAANAVEITVASQFDRITSNDPTADPVTFTDNVSRNVHNIRTAEYKDQPNVTDYINGYASFFRFNRTLEKVIDIGVWDMDATDTITISLATHSISVSKIRSIDVLIVSDDGNAISPLDLSTADGTANAGRYAIQAVGDISLRRVTGGWFDNTGYDDGAINRGYITIRYVI